MSGEGPVSFPRMLQLRQHFSSPALSDVPEAVRKEIFTLKLEGRIHAGESVAIAVGSRGIRDIALIVRTLVEELKQHGARPFIVPAMGSHGGATAAGQTQILAELGVTPQYTGAPIHSSMETVQVDGTEEDIAIYMDKLVCQADHLVMVNRIKVHTDFTGSIQSGLLKMLLIGLGKHRGASIYHRAFVQHSFDRIVRAVSGRVLKKCKVLFGLAVVESHDHRTALLKAVEPARFLSEELELLRQSKKWMPRLPFHQIDLLIVDEMGKEIAGSGMDTNILGRKGWPVPVQGEEFPNITRVYVRDLTAASHGNAVGIGMADFAHTRLIEKIDLQAMYVNAVTSCTPFGASLPVHFASDRLALENAFRTIGLVEPGRQRIVHIRNTLELEEMLVSDVYLPEIKARSDLEIVREAREMRFDKKGDLLPAL